MVQKRSDPRTRRCIELTCFHRMSEEVTTMLEFSQSPERPRLSEILRKCCILGFLVAVRARSLTQLMAVRVVWSGLGAFCAFFERPPNHPSLNSDLSSGIVPDRMKPAQKHHSNPSPRSDVVSAASYPAARVAKSPQPGHRRLLRAVHWHTPPQPSPTHQSART